jgi:Na+-transporting NADH:ubiquinone oxidoreductase subunit A
VRIVSGNVLTGDKILPNGYLGFYHNQLTVIPEGNYYEFVGWAAPGFGKYSFSRTFFSWISQSKKYRLDTNLHGGNRAFVMTGIYEQVMPLNILPMQLVKACMINDIDLMEGLGIYEVDEEDFALCEFIDTSKTEMQSIIREGLNVMRKETS